MQLHVPHAMGQESWFGMIARGDVFGSRREFLDQTDKQRSEETEKLRF